MGERLGILQRLLGLFPYPDTPREYFAHLPTLVTPRLILRPLTMRDAPDMYRYSRDPEVARYVLWEPHASLSDTRSYLRFALHQYREGEPGSWGMVLRSSGHVVGTIGFMSFDPENSILEVGYSMARDLWGHGLMAEALEPVLQEAFCALKVHRVEGQHATENPASGRVMEKCGMTHEGHLRRRIYNKGQYMDVELWGILREDWQKKHAGL